MKCSKCGQQMRKRGGQYICMNEDCPNYLVGQETGGAKLADELKKL